MGLSLALDPISLAVQIGMDRGKWVVEECLFFLPLTVSVLMEWDLSGLLRYVRFTKEPLMVEM